MNQKNTELATENIGKLLLRLAVPAVTAQIINVLYNIVDRIYIGHIPGTGAAALTGVGVTMPVIMAITAFAALVSMGGAPRASIMMGRQDHEKAERILGNCATMLIITALILTIAFQIFGKDVLLMFGASDNTIGYAWEYMSIYSLGTLFVQLSLGLNAFITCQGFSKTSMYTVLIGAIANIVLDPIFIFGFGMGVQGAALATIISQGISFVWVIKFLLSDRTILKIKLKNMKLSSQIILPCLALGASPFIMQFTESVLSVCFNTSLYKYGGDLAVGAMTILSSVMQFSMLPLQGLTQGAQPIISYNYGALNLERIEKTVKILLTCSLVYSTLLWTISMFTPQLLVSMFTDNQELKAYGIWALHIYMATSLLFGAQIACQQSFIALGKAKISLFLALLRKVFLLIPLIYILPCFMENKVFSVFLAEPIADAIAVSVTVTMFTISFRKIKRQITKEA